jgi:hypothetical protein
LGKFQEAADALEPSYQLLVKLRLPRFGGRFFG